MPKPMSTAQLANVALELMAKASMQASDDNLATVSQARAFLRAISTGQLVVLAAPTPEKEVPAGASSSEQSGS